MTRAPLAPAPARLRPGDLAGLASVGLRTRKLRASLSALGIAIGVAPSWPSSAWPARPRPGC